MAYTAAYRLETTMSMCERVYWRAQNSRFSNIPQEWDAWPMSMVDYSGNQEEMNPSTAP
jgi:hypothetical protein